MKNWIGLQEMDRVEEISRVADVFYVCYKRAPRDLKIEVREYASGKYMGFANYKIWGPKQATPYISLHLQDSVEDALNDAIDGIRMFDNEKIPNKLLFFVSTRNDSIIYDGDGCLVTNEEVDKRRKEIL